MEQEKNEHEIVRFRREEIAPLESFPSACLPLHNLCRGRSSRLLRPVLLLIFIVVAFASGLYFIGVDAVGNERLRLQAERAIERLAGFDVDVTLGKLHLGFGGSSLFALQVDDVLIVRASDKTPIATAGNLSFGLRALPLISGRIELAQVAMAGAAFSPSAMPSGGGLAALIASPEVLGPDLLSDAIFGTVHRAFEMTRASGLNGVSLTDVSLLAPDGDEPDLVIEALVLSREEATSISFEGTAHYRGRPTSFDGQAQRDAQTGAIEDLSFNLAAPEDGSDSGKSATGLVRALDSFGLRLSGREAAVGHQGRLQLDMRLENAVVGFDEDEILVDSASARMAFADTDDDFSVPALRIAIGRTQINLEGTISPTAETGKRPVYRIDFASRNSVLAPVDSPEPPLSFGMRMTGRFEPSAARLTAERIDMRTAEGELTAVASLTMPAGMSPGLTLALYISDLPTAHAKQFWPWFAAPGARNWTLVNVFGGRVRDSNLRLSVPPGRLGNGVPLAQDEVFGSFSLTDTRFDIAGRIPAVRDGEGSVSFRGTDVKVDLSSGAIYMPSGRLVDASQGTLTIDAAHLKPRIGKLEIGVAGDASAIAELASYEPIDASRFHDLSPEDLSGEMSGHISADIPLQADIPAANLSWNVALDYKDLSIAKPFEGQEVTNASGTLLISPDQAAISAEADLNAVPAEIRIVEPLGGSKVERVRRIELKIDDAEREKLFPGLGLLVSGPFTVIYEEQPDKRQKINVAFDTANLTVPWIGWRKGAGIPATASFYMDQDGDTVELSDFVLEGESFALNGHIRLSGGELEEARFDRARFNRGDDYSATIKRSGGGYAVSVQGASLDARGLVKRALGKDGADAQGSGGGTAAPITVEATIGRADGFNGESLSKVQLSYATDGKGPEHLNVTGAAAEYGSVSLAKGVDQGRQTVRATSSNAGAILRFLDIYKHVEGGNLSLALDGAGTNDTLAGRFDLRDFWVVNEPRMRSLVAATDQRGDGQVDATRVHFERGGAILTMGRERLGIENGVLRGPLIGSTFQGTLYDPDNNMDITGTFMPVYGLNRIFGELPLIGQILGNGRDRGLIGITYRLSGKFDDPTLQVNPISAIAPGFLRQLFEFR